MLSLCHTVQIESAISDSSSGSSGSHSGKATIGVGLSEAMVPAIAMVPHPVPVMSSGYSVAPAGLPSDRNSTTSSVSVDEVDGECYEYHASSPDEKALVEACRM